MKKLVLTAVFFGGLAQLATGCLIASDDGDPPPVDTTGAIEATWSLVEGDLNSPSTCYDGAFMALHALDSFDIETVDVFDCFEYAAYSRELVPDAYVAWTTMEDDAQNVYALSVDQNVDIAAGADTPADFIFSVDRAAFDVQWDIYDGPDQIDCADVGANEFWLTHTYQPTGEDLRDAFDCGLYEGTTNVLPLGAFSISPSLEDGGVDAIAVGESIDTELLYGGEFYALDLIVIDLQAP